MAARGLHVSVKIDAAKATQAFKDARLDVNNRMKDGLKRAGETVALPAARHRASHLKVGGQSTAGSLIIRARARDAVLTTKLRGKLARAVGLQEMGGVVKTPILPTKKRALVVNGQPVANVTTPRRYKPQRFMSTAVQSHRSQIDRVVRDELVKAFRGLT